MKFFTGRLFFSGLVIAVFLALSPGAHGRNPEPDPDAALFVQSGLFHGWWEQKLLDPLERAGNQLGWSVALDGDTVLLGAMQTNVEGDEGRGAVQVYRRSNGLWAFAQTLIAADGEAGDAFGTALAIHGTTAAISASQRSVDGNWGVGAVYLFEDGGHGWQHVQTLVPPGAPMHQKFGVSLALDATTLAVASHIGNRVYLYERTDGQWVQTTVLAPPTGVSGQFGLSVAVDGDRVAVGAPSTAEGAPLVHGSAWVFERVGGVWQAGQKLLPEDFDPGYAGYVYFGQNVALQGDTLLVGARLARSEGLPGTPGAAYIYEYDSTLDTWVQAQKIGAPRANGQFGSWVALDGERAVIGAPFETVGFNGWQGRAYVYERDPGNAWSLAHELVASDGTDKSQYGFALDMQGDTIAIGAVRDRSYIGAGYLYQWAREFTVSPSVTEGGGSISPDMPQVVMEGTTASFSLTPATGYVIGSVGGSCGGSLVGEVFTTAPVAEDCTVEADFAPQTLSVTASVVSGPGSISPQGTQPVAYGDSLTFFLQPASGHAVVAVEGSCGGTLSESLYLTAPVVADCTVEVRFGPHPDDLIFADGFDAAP